MTDRRWILTVIIIAIVVANLPTVVGFLAAPHGSVYTGITSIAPGDTNVYLSYLEQARQGHYIFRDLYTAEPQHANLLNPFWLLLGVFGSLLHLAPLATYLVSRVILGALLIAVIARLAAAFFAEQRWRRLAILLAVFASGVGAWFAPFIDAAYHHTVPLHLWPMDLWVSEAFTFLSLRHSPHFLAATILIIGSVGFFMRSIERRSTPDAVFAGLCMLALFSFHPFHAVSLALVTVGMLVVLIVRREHGMMRQVLRFGLSWLIAVPAILYQYLIIRYDPIASGRATQNILPTTNLPVTIVSYGFLLIGAIVGGISLWRTGRLRSQLLVAWAVFHAASIYAPIFFNRRLTHALDIPLAFLVAAGIAMIVRKFALRRMTTPMFAGILLVMLFGVSNLWVYAQDLSFLLSAPSRTYPYYFYLHDGYRDAFSWLEQRSDADTVVLSSAITGNFIPAWSGRKVVIGHTVETVDYEAKRSDVVLFYDPSTSDDWRRTFLRQQRVTDVIVGPWERDMGLFDPAASTQLSQEYVSGNVVLYRVVAAD